MRDQLEPDSGRVSRRSRWRCHGRVSPNDQWSVHRWRPRVTGSPRRRRSSGGPSRYFSASRFRQPPHRAPAGGARCDRGSPPAPRHVHAARDRAPARSGDVERHAALAPASPSDRRRARDSTEARGMDALALAISANRRHPRRPEPRAGRASPCVQLGCAAVASGDVANGSGASRLCIGAVLGAAAAALACLLARRPFRSYGRSGVRRVAAHPCAAALVGPTLPRLRARRCPPGTSDAYPTNAFGSATVESFPVLRTAADQAEPAMFETALCSSVVQGASSSGS